MTSWPVDGNSSTKMQKTLIIFLLTLTLASCDTALSPPPIAIPENTPTLEVTPTSVFSYRPGSWVRQTPYQWTHDGMPYESEHFIIYSDSAMEEEKVRFAEEAEKFLEFILVSLHIADDELRYPPGRGKIEIFGSTKHTLELGGGYAYYGGFLFTYDQGEYRMYEYSWPDSFLFKPLFTHEITHDVAFLLMGYSSHDNLLVATWFDEGLAVYVSEDDPYKISSLAQLTGLRQQLEDVPGKGNPTLIKRWEEIPYQYFTDEMINKLYALFELAVGYLVDTYGVEKCKQVYLDTRAGLTFEESFASQYGISLTDYQQSFFSRMEDYLP
jgi:hypothetical protein